MKRILKSLIVANALTLGGTALAEKPTSFQDPNATPLPTSLVCVYDAADFRKRVWNIILSTIPDLDQAKLNLDGIDSVPQEFHGEEAIAELENDNASENRANQVIREISSMAAKISTEGVNCASIKELFDSNELSDGISSILAIEGKILL